jgi:hypothetical protein
MKFSEMCSIEGLVTKHAVYAEVLGRLKSLKGINLKCINHQVLTVLKTQKSPSFDSTKNTEISLWISKAVQ